MISAVRNAAFQSVFDTTTTSTPTTTDATTPKIDPTTGLPIVEPPKGAAEPSQPRTLPTNPSGMGRDEFLKMLVAQLKNQDPLNPMDGKDMAAQLAQFSTVEQLMALNTSMDATKASQQATTDAITALGKQQASSADDLAQLIEGQMAVATVGKIGVTTGNTMFVDRDGTGTIMIDAGNMKGAGRVTFTNDKGETIGSGAIPSVVPGQQSFDLRDVIMDPPLKPGKYTYKVEVATDGDLQWNSVKTYTAGRITGLKYDNGNPMLIIGDSITVPMSQLTQIRS
jgi:flagellar basal-body rod modification protein FlgD